MDKKQKTENEKRKKDQRSGTTSHFEWKAAGERRCDDGRIYPGRPLGKKHKSCRPCHIGCAMLFVEEAPGCGGGHHGANMDWQQSFNAYCFFTEDQVHPLVSFLISCLFLVYGWSVGDSLCLGECSAPITIESGLQQFLLIPVESYTVRDAKDNHCIRSKIYSGYLSHAHCAPRPCSFWSLTTA